MDWDNKLRYLFYLWVQIEGGGGILNMAYLIDQS